jgi:hypothetical protein
MGSEKLKIALLVDDLAVSKWQACALERVADLVEVVLIVNCKNTVTKRHVIRNAGYYFLNLISIKSDLTQKRKIQFENVPVVDFYSRYEKAWQWIPDEVVTVLVKSGCQVIMKFGMSLLKMDNLTAMDVLSFHHGDPRYFRGRPAGFYELLYDAKSIGLIVQKLSNVLDGGQVLALGHAKAVRYSYRKTVRGLYQSSPELLRRAVINYLADAPINIEPIGKNYHLPSNYLIILFCARLLIRKMKRLFYGIFWEKRWNIAVFENMDPLTTGVLAVSDAKCAVFPVGYNFYADPFFSADGSSIRVEALVGATGRGRIIELDAYSLGFQRILLAGPHFSYPFTFVEKECEYILPEVAGHESPYLLEVSNKAKKIPLLGLEKLRLIDPSLVEVDGRYYLFGGHQGSAADMLYLYLADSAIGPYEPHRMNPVVIDPVNARMGGRFLVCEGRLYRLGQDNSDSYGNGLRVMEVLRIDPEAYEEREVARLCFSDANGPHTLDIRNGRAVLDFYVDKFSPLAGYRRFAAKVYGKTFKYQG